MTQRRKRLLPLLVLFVGFFFLPALIGVAELALWVLLFTAWVVAFAWWGRHDPSLQPEQD